jgi:hypothetical protein
MTITYNALSQEEFERRVRLVTPDLKILTKYDGFNRKVLVQDKFGICEVSPASLFMSTPTIQCAVDKTSYWLNKVGTLHNGKYDYSKVVYTHNNKKVIIICPVHGEFLQSPVSHVDHGCCQCAKENTKGGHGGLNVVTAERKKDEWENKPAYVYHIKLESENESFYKVGITTQDLQKRFRNLYPYTYEVLSYIPTNLYEAVKLEKDILKSAKKSNYQPAVKFDGYTECFTTEIDINIFLKRSNLIKEYTSNIERYKYSITDCERTLDGYQKRIKDLEDKLLEKEKELAEKVNTINSLQNSIFGAEEAVKALTELI